MPNGGVPLHMILFPAKNAKYVVYCHGNVLHIFAREEWEEKKTRGNPLVTFSESEWAALTGFPKYWNGDRELPACHPDKGVNAIFDFRTITPRICGCRVFKIDIINHNVA